MEKKIHERKKKEIQDLRKKEAFILKRKLKTKFTINLKLGFKPFNPRFEPFKLNRLNPQTKSNRSKNPNLIRTETNR